MHEQLHIPDDIERNGAPHRWHSGPTENNHIMSVKNYASQTNRRRGTLDFQIGTRNAESYIINSAYQKMSMAYSTLPTDSNPTVEDYEGGTPKGTKAILSILRIGNVLSCDTPIWQGLDQGPIHPLLCTFLEQHFGLTPRLSFPQVAGSRVHTEVRLCCEYTRGGTIFHAHPNYRQGGPWYDLAMFRWAKEDGN